MKKDIERISELESKLAEMDIRNDKMVNTINGLTKFSRQQMLINDRLTQAIKEISKVFKEI